MKGKWGLIALGFLSGLVTDGIFALATWVWTLGSLGEALSYFFYLFPGLIFGIFVSLYFKKEKGFSAISGFIFLSTIAFIAAAFAGMISGIFGGNSLGGVSCGTFTCTANYTSTGAIGGLLGAFILSFAYDNLVSSQGSFMRLALSLLGAVLGVVGFLVGSFWPTSSLTNFVLFLVWQTGMAIGMSFFLNKRSATIQSLSSIKPNPTP